ncbi:MAG: hypothetical protein AABW53_02510 [Nanoarchaeota archaeon]
MRVIEFPDVKIDSKQSGGPNPDYFNLILGSEEQTVLSRATANTLIYGMENEKKFLGATIDAYLQGVQTIAPEVAEIENLWWEALNIFVQKFVAEDWTHVMVLRKNSRTIKHYFTGREHVMQYLQGGNNFYNRQTIARNREEINTNVFFFPSPKFTQEIWGFDYKPEELERIVEIPVW